jgi:hypothetical protein
VHPVQATLAFLLFCLCAAYGVTPALAGPAPAAVCTQIEPVYQLQGISYYGGNGMCTAIAANPGLFAWPAMPLDPAALGMPPACRFWLNADHTEYAVAWSVTGFEWLAMAYCQRLAAEGVPVVYAAGGY